MVSGKLCCVVSNPSSCSLSSRSRKPSFTGYRGAWASGPTSFPNKVEGSGNSEILITTWRWYMSSLSALLDLLGQLSTTFCQSRSRAVPREPSRVTATAEFTTNRNPNAGNTCLCWVISPALDIISDSFQNVFDLLFRKELNVSRVRGSTRVDALKTPVFLDNRYWCCCEMNVRRRLGKVCSCIDQ